MKMHIRSKKDQLLIAQTIHIEFPDLTLVTVEDNAALCHAMFELDTPDEIVDTDMIERLIQRSSQLVTV